MGAVGIARRPHGGDTGVTEAVASGGKLGSLPLTEIIRRGWRRMMETPALVVMGFVGIGLGLICLAVMFARGGVPIPPEGDLHKPATFNIAVGIYILTTALLLPSAGFSERGRKRWVRWNVGLFAYAYIIETVQVFRGLDPRFSRHGTPLDQIAGGVFFLTALGARPGRRHHVPAVMASQAVHQPVFDHPGGAIGALEAMAAVAAQGQRREPAAVEE